MAMSLLFLVIYQGLLAFGDCIFVSILFTNSFITTIVYRDPSINHACVLNKTQAMNGIFPVPFKLLCLSDLSFYSFIKMGTMFPFKILFVFVPSTFFNRVHIKWYLNVYCPILRPGYFGINGNFLNFYKFKAFFLFLYCSRKATSLSKGLFVVIKYQ